MPIELNLTDFLVSPITGESPQREFFEATKRNQCFSGGFGSGKTYIGCKKLLALALAFPNSRWLIGREKYSDLVRTTVPTFYKVCPEDAYDEKHGGRKTKDLVQLINDSIIYFMHFNEQSEQIVRGLEVNGAFIDQAEELSENMYTLLSTRIGRWDKGEVPAYMLTPEWPRNAVTGRPKVPSYFMLAVNPDSELHYIYRRYHPDSLEFQQKYSKTHVMIQATTLDNPTIDPEIIAEMMTKDQVFIDRFVYGKWGISESAIHRVQTDSILSVGEEWVENLLRKARLFRILDHGDTAPTCCLWVAAFDGQYFVYREYYQPEQVISYHRKAIHELSHLLDGTPEFYSGNFADPDIFSKKSQKAGIRFSVSDEYIDTNLITDSPAIHWTPASNDEYGTRNRINECLRVDPSLRHPTTGKVGAPRLYFIKRSENYPNGCYESILQTKGQKRQELGSENGKPIFSDERDENITDHAYDCVRYFISMHYSHKLSVKVAPQPGSFYAAQKEAKKLSNARRFQHIY